MSDNNLTLVRPVHEGMKPPAHVQPVTNLTPGENILINVPGEESSTQVNPSEEGNAPAVTDNVVVPPVLADDADADGQDQADQADMPQQEDVPDDNDDAFFFDPIEPDNDMNPEQEPAPAPEHNKGEVDRFSLWKVLQALTFLHEIESKLCGIASDLAQQQGIQQPSDWMGGAGHDKLVPLQGNKGSHWDSLLG